MTPRVLLDLVTVNYVIQSLPFCFFSRYCMPHFELLG